MIRTSTFLVAMVALAASAFAHTPLKSTSPESGSVLAASPDQLVLEFAKPVQLTILRLESADGDERTLSFTPTAASATFTAAAPALPPGRNTVHWTALSGDGHVIEGTIVIEIRPSGTPIS